MDNFFSFFCILGILGATFFKSTKKCILSLWWASILMGAWYLSLGIEFMAMIQCIIATLVALSLIFFCTLLGEQTFTFRRNIWFKISAFIVVGIFCYLFILVFMENNFFFQNRHIPLEVSMSEIGEWLLSYHFVSLHLIAASLFIAVIGGTCICRLEGEAVGEASPKLKI